MNNVFDKYLEEQMKSYSFKNSFFEALDSWNNSMPRGHKLKKFSRHAVRRASLQLERLKARGARPRVIKRAEAALEARQDTVAAREAREAREAEAQEFLTKLVDEHFGTEG